MKRKTKTIAEINRENREKKDLLLKLLKQNTGTSYLDSGGKGDRLWQRNKKKTKKKFDQEQFVTYTICEYGIVTKASLWHTIIQNFSLDDRCRAFNGEELKVGWELAHAERYPSEREAYEVHLYDIVTTGYPDYKLTETEVEVSKVFNTYNSDCDFDYVFKYQTISDMLDINYAILSIHTGCDIRSGYTDLVMFKYEDYGWGVRSLPFSLVEDRGFDIFEPENIYQEWSIEIDDKVILLEKEDAKWIAEMIDNKRTSSALCDEIVQEYKARHQ